MWLLTWQKEEAQCQKKESVSKDIKSAVIFNNMSESLLAYFLKFLALSQKPRLEIKMCYPVLQWVNS